MHPEIRSLIIQSNSYLARELFPNIHQSLINGDCMYGIIHVHVHAQP